MHYRHRFIALMALFSVLASISSVSADFLPVILFWNGLPVNIIILGLTIISFLISTIAVFGASYWFASIIDVPSEYRRIALISGVVGAGASVGGPLAFLAISTFSFRTISVVDFLILWIPDTVKHGIQFSLVSVAGASVAYFQSTSSRIFPDINCRTLVLRSDAGIEQRVADLDAADRLQSGRLVHIPDTGHYVFRDAYDAAYTELRTYLRRV